MRVITLLAAAMCAGEAAAQSAPGDTALSYRGGVVYDDDLVPGRGVNQPYLGDEQGGGGAFGGVDDARSAAPAPRGRLAVPERRANSPDLIGPDGRADAY